MIEKIKIKNYKAFKEATIPFKPITIFLGANNAGKSSIIRLLLMLQQTATANPNTYRSALKLHGNLNMGKPEYLFYRMDKTKKIEISFTIQDSQLKEYFGNIHEVYDILNKISQNKTQESSAKKRSKTNNIGNELLMEIVRSRYMSLFNLSDLFFFPSKSLDNDVKRVMALVSAIKAASDKKTNVPEFEIKYAIGYRARQQSLVIKDFSISYFGKTLFKIKKSKNENWNVQSDFVCFNSTDAIHISKHVAEDKSIFHFIKNGNNESSSLLTKSILGLTLRCIDNLRSEFDNEHINYVQPLRAHPQRYYMLNNINSISTINTLDGNELAEVLKDNESVHVHVNEWLVRFGLSPIDVKKDVEIIHHLILKQNGLDLDISDVGFGVSQLLPIITQSFLSRPHSATIVEQPEIHLHPRLQADLADLFIDVVKKDFKRNSNIFERTVIIESHSEYMLRRLRRRMSECDIISRDNVSISLFHPYSEGKNDGASIENLSIEKKGAFEWPEEYYGAELQKDITEFLGNQR